MANKKYLPIKIVEKRKGEDESLTEGGRGDAPAWMYKVSLEERASMIYSTLNNVEEQLKKRVGKENYIPATVELKLDSRTLSKTHRSSIREMIDVNRKNNLIGFFNEASLLIKIENLKDLKLIERNIGNLETNMQGLASIIETNIFKPRIEIDESEFLKVKLINFQEHEINVAVHKAFKKKCRELGLEIERKDYSSDVVIYKVPYVEKAMPVLQSFEGLSSIEDMPTYNLSFNSQVNEETPFTNVKLPEIGKNYPTIGVLDSGIALNNGLSPWILKEKHTNYIEEDIDTNHGTAVASILLYGDSLESEKFTELDGCYIFDATIVPKKSLINKVTEWELIDNISEAISNNANIKIWNLCVGWGVEVDEHRISDFGAALDYLQDEYNIIISTSVGNCKNFEINKAVGKIQRSADSVRSISVGSIAHFQSDSDEVKINQSSPFSRIGSGPFNLVKPELTHYGGNAGIDDQGNKTSSGVKTLNKNGNICEKAGTSFSTPRITSILAGLDNELVEDFDPLILKALIIHSAKFPNSDLPLDERLKQVGFGKPSSIKDILYNSENEITLVIRDTLEKGNFIEILDFPYPEDMVEGNNYYGEITATLVSSPDLVASQGEEYCQSNIDVMFGTYNEKVKREGRTIRNPIGRDSASVNLLNPSIYSKRAVRKNVSFNNERILMSNYQNFKPVKKWAINLDEISETNKMRYIEYPKRWFLKIEGLYRDHLEKTEENLSTDFCLILTIKDTKNNTKVYDNITAGLEANNFIQNNIKIKSDIKLKN